MSEALKYALSQMSKTTPVAFVETDYFGGRGTQGATVYRDGKCVMDPVSGDQGQINAALRMLGVSAKGCFDEFEAAGLVRHRNNDAWIEESSKNIDV